MKRIQQFCLLALISLGFVSCGDSHASLAGEALDPISKDSKNLPMVVRSLMP